MKIFDLNPYFPPFSFRMRLLHGMIARQAFVFRDSGLNKALWLFYIDPCIVSECSGHIYFQPKFFQYILLIKLI